MASRILKAFSLAGLLAGTAAGSAAMVRPALAQPDLSQPASGPGGQSGWVSGKHGNACFFTTQLGGWRAPDDRTIYFQVNRRDVVRLDMEGKCPFLTSPDPHLVTHFRGNDTVCSALDWDIKVSPGFGAGNVAVPCIVRSMTRLTPAEIAALPRSARPF